MSYSFDSRINHIGRSVNTDCPKCGRSNALLSDVILADNLWYIRCRHDLTCRYDNKAEVIRDSKLNQLLKEYEINS